MIRIVPSAKVLTLALLSFLVSCVSDVDSRSIAEGDWEFTMSSPFGQLNAEVSMDPSGASLDGTFDLGNGRQWPIENGSINGSLISFSLARDGSTMVYEMRGEVTEGNIEGTATAMGTEVPWSMTRKN